MSACSGVVASEVSLGETEEEVRAALHCEDPGALETYPIHLTRIDGSDTAHRCIMPPHVWELFGVRGFRMLAFGIIWFWATSQRRAAWLSEVSDVTWVGTNEGLWVSVTNLTDEEFRKDILKLAKGQGMID